VEDNSSISTEIARVVLLTKSLMEIHAMSHHVMTDQSSMPKDR